MPPLPFSPWPTGLLGSSAPQLHPVSQQWPASVHVPLVLGCSAAGGCQAADQLLQTGQWQHGTAGVGAQQQLRQQGALHLPRVSACGHWPAGCAQALHAAVPVAVLASCVVAACTEPQPTAPAVPEQLLLCPKCAPPQVSLHWLHGRSGRLPTCAVLCACKHVLQVSAASLVVCEAAVHAKVGCAPHTGLGWAATCAPATRHAMPSWGQSRAHTARCTCC